MANEPIVTLLASVIFNAANNSITNSTQASLGLNDWWGPKALQGHEDTSIRPAQITFDDAMITDLQYRLRNHIKFQPPLEDAAFSYGFNTNAILPWLTYWAEQYPFKQREAYLNQFPQFKTNIQGLDIHFIRVKPAVTANKTVIPLLLLHGWPGSIREFYNAIPLLTAVSPDRDFVVDLIVPCLPGFGFSDGAVRIGLGSAQIAVVMRNLMHRLGYEQYYLQGGDWGGFITSNMATIFPNEVLGFHTNWVFITSTEEAFKSLEPLYPTLLQESGYFHEAATKPDTVGVALTDSPAGLLAWILEKFILSLNQQSQSAGGLNNTYTPEEMIDDLMFYWVPRCITTTLRIYAESYSIKHRALGIEAKPTPVPTWVTQGKNELTNLPRTILEKKYTNLLNASSLDFGGHFLAMQFPKEFSENVLTALKGFRAWHQKYVNVDLNSTFGISG